MTPSNYLPPFTPEQRASAGGIHTPHRQQVPGLDPEPEVTYADFLGDEVDD